MIEAPCVANLVALAEAYSAARKLSISTVSGQFHGAPHFFAELKAGDRSVTLAKYDEIVFEFSEKWPPGWPWPRMTAISLTRPGKKSVNGDAPLYGEKKRNRVNGAHERKAHHPRSRSLP